MTKTPTKPGVFWAALDDGNGNLDVLLISVRYYGGETSFESGAVCEFLDGSGWGFEAFSFEQNQLVSPTKTVYAASRGSTSRGEVKVTWHGEVKPPLSARKQQPVELWP